MKLSVRPIDNECVVIVEKRMKDDESGGVVNNKTHENERHVQCIYIRSFLITHTHIHHLFG
jgi:cAMP phosphodiesterase